MYALLDILPLLDLSARWLSRNYGMLEWQGDYCDGNPSYGSFPPLQTFSNGAFPFVVVILSFRMIMLMAQIVLDIKMKCVAKLIMAIHWSSDYMPSIGCHYMSGPGIGKSRWLLLEELLLSADQEPLAKRVLEIPFLLLWTIARDRFADYQKWKIWLHIITLCM